MRYKKTKNMKIEFEWTKELTVKDDVIDGQHKQLLNEINELLGAILDNKSLEIISDTINFLDEYIRKHFAYEENYMREHNYPRLDEHIVLHRDFSAHYNNFKKKFENNPKDESLALEVENYIGTWWINHIGKEDKKYSDYISVLES